MFTIYGLIHNSYQSKWHGDFKLHLTRQCYESVYILDGRNAGLKKSVCPSFRLESLTKDDCAVLNSDWVGMEVEEAVDLLLEADWVKNKWGGYDSIEADGIRIHRDEIASNRVLNPNRLDRWQPLKSMPKKWNLPLVVRALVNSQVTTFHDYRYTDDYAYDNSYNFGKGEASNMYLAENLVDSPSGWRAYANSPDTVFVGCHSFDAYTLTIVDEAVKGA